MPLLSHEASELYHIICDCLLSSMDHFGKKKKLHHGQFSSPYYFWFCRKWKRKRQTQKFFHLQSLLNLQPRKNSLYAISIVLSHDVQQIPYKIATAEAPHLQLRELGLPRSYSPSVNSTTKVFTHCFPQVSHLEGIQVYLIKGSRCTRLDYMGLKGNFVFSSLRDLFLNSMAYFHNPAVLLQNLYPKKL